MRAKSLALLVLALGCGLVASIGITQVMSKRDTGPAAPTGDTQTVFVALEDIHFRERVTAQVLRMEEWPKDKVPSGVLTKIEDIEGRRTRSKLFAGEPILDNKLFAQGNGGGGVTGRIPKGYRPVTVKVDEVSGGAHMIQPGDRVDVLVYLRRDPTAGILETKTRTLLEDIKVFAVDAIVEIDSEDEDSPAISARTISLLVTPRQAAKVTLASQLGKINLVMRSPDDDTAAEMPSIAVSDLFSDREKGDRDDEELGDKPEPEGGGFREFLDRTLAKASEEQPDATPVEEATETWSMRVWEGTDVREVVLEMEIQSGPPGSDSSVKHWTVGSADPASTNAPPPPSGGDSEDTDKPADQPPQTQGGETTPQDG